MRPITITKYVHVQYGDVIRQDECLALDQGLQELDIFGKQSGQASGRGIHICCFTEAKHHAGAIADDN